MLHAKHTIARNMRAAAIYNMWWAAAIEFVMMRALRATHVQLPNNAKRTVANESALAHSTCMQHARKVPANILTAVG